MKICLLFGFLCVAFLFGAKLRAQEALASDHLIYSTSHPEETVQASSDVAFTVREVSVSGNKRTRRSTVLRELPFQAGESYPLPEIIKKLEQAKQQLMNTSLFRNVVVSLRSVKDLDAYVTVDVEEKWYFYPQPFLRLANGTFSQWNERGRKLEHLNYGLKLTQYNFSGRGDKMYVNLTNGYTKKVDLQYRGFFLDKELKWSSSINFTYGKNRELNYATENNKLLPIKTPDGYLYEFYESSVDVSYRPAIKTRHTFSIGYKYNRIGDTVRKLNSFYTPSNNTFNYPYITYRVLFQDLDFNPYPTKGKEGEVSLHKAGFGGDVNLWQLSLKGSRYWPLGTRYFFSLNAGGVLKLPFRQPYFTQHFLGYGDAYLQGYENYIIDGVTGGYAKATISRSLLKTAVSLPQNKWFKSLRSIPVKLFVKSFVNTGYAYNGNETPYNGLNNRMLYSAGVGADLVLFTDLVFKFEWSFNQLGQNGLYLHQ
ncbi:POTRA domain-containing protein [Flavisolibacter nicotianae]|uniref:POTRA domain-containing protein n=1 Tax=Flavisolibacter nicotianae TaxID=2364882 RepID=UPI000EAFC35E|nr:POTRA domain-containing protein [Flavisolibacter nicotianae]